MVAEGMLIVKQLIRWHTMAWHKLEIEMMMIERGDNGDNIWCEHSTIYKWLD